MAGEPTTGSVFRQKAETPRWRQLNLRNPLIQVALFTALIVGIVLMMTRTLMVGGETLTADQVGEPAQTNIRATRDFVYVETDHEATRKKREEAAAAVPRIYDYNATLRDQKTERITDAMAALRTVLRRAADDKERLSAVEPEDNDAGAPENEENENEQPVATNTELSDEEKDEAASTGRASFEQTLQVTVRDDVFIVLTRHNFSRKAEKAITGLVRDVMANPIVPNRRLLTVEGRRGITLRTIVGGDVVRTEARYEYTDITDASEIRRELIRLAGIHLDGSFPPDLRDAVLALAQDIIEPNTTLNEAETELARRRASEDVPDLVIQTEFRQGQAIVDHGHIITPRHLRIIEEMDGGAGISRLTRAQMMVGALVITLLFLILIFIFSKANIRRFRSNAKDLVLVGAVLMLVLGLQQAMIVAIDGLATGYPPEQKVLFYYAVPLAVGAMVVRLVLNSEMALIFAIIIAIFGGIAADGSLSYAAFALLSSTAGAGAVSRVTHRMDILKAALKVGGVNVGTLLAILLIGGETGWSVYIWALLGGFAGGLLSGILLSALMPLVEWIFDYTTDIKLLELADLNHPALAELSMKAPGSYHHSVIVGNLCRAAADAIGANSLLARVGAYYHDLGKGKNPQYFAENQRVGHNPHDKLKPNMSALVIKAHVKDGLEIAKQHNLPKEIEAFIAQHHGTMLIAYFYHRAKSMEDPSIAVVDEKDYRYPGPKPQTRETAICMLADGIEAASRAMPDPTPDRLKGLVQKMINKCFADGQLDECDLTLNDLNAIAKAFIRVLVGMYHSRPQYPSDKKKETRSGQHERPNKNRTTGNQPAQDRPEKRASSSGTSKQAIEEIRKGADPNRVTRPLAATGRKTKGKVAEPEEDARKSAEEGASETAKDQPETSTKRAKRNKAKADESGEKGKDPDHGEGKDQGQSQNQDAVPPADAQAGQDPPETETNTDSAASADDKQTPTATEDSTVKSTEPEHETAVEGKPETDENGKRQDKNDAAAETGRNEADADEADAAKDESEATDDIQATGAEPATADGHGGDEATSGANGAAETDEESDGAAADSEPEADDSDDDQSDEFDDTDPPTLRRLGLS